jgi:hypothetical protein
MIETNL